MFGPAAIFYMDVFYFGDFGGRKARDATLERRRPSIQPECEDTRMADDHSTKLCPKCDTVKPVSEFGIQRNRDDGLASRCRVCVRAYAKARRKIVPPNGSGAMSGLGALTRKAMVAEYRITEARAARHKVAAEQRVLAAGVLAPALAALKAAAPAVESLMVALKAATSALEILMGSPTVRKARAKPRASNGTASEHVRHASPPPIREVKTIVTEDRVTAAEAKRIQEREIVARAEWRPSI